MNIEATQVIQPQPRLGTMDEASWELKRSVSAIYYRVRVGEIAAHLVDGRIMVDLDEVKRMFETPQRVGVRKKLLRRPNAASEGKSDLF
jgi:hypothetical protein